QRETGCAMLVIEHDMALLRSLADRFVALHQGEVLADGSPDAVLADERVTAAYLGGATLDSPTPDPAGGRST
ncbi:MAG: ABC transporter ATP-binding protein C-terminal domain-containing protein, partial [Mycobacteriales bacterium]